VDPMLGYVFEPSAEVVLDAMLPFYIQHEVFQMILDARASEHSARMVAMKNATDNANQFIKDLTLEYNKMRQAGITTELLEIATGGPTSLPVGEGVLGRLFNVTGDPVDNRGPVKFTQRYPIHRPAPQLTEQDTKIQILETGIKVIDLICPFSKGGKVGAFGGA